MDLILETLAETWRLLLDSAVYILFGLLVAGLLRMIVQPATIARHLGHGRVSSVFKAALFGIPLPLCSCGVVPAAAGLKKQGANTGATTAFLISTPESGVDSIAISYALLDPLLTIARPVAGFITAIVAGLVENLGFKGQKATEQAPDLSCPVDGCCDGADCPPEHHRNHHGRREKLVAGMRFAFLDLWGELVGWFAVGLLAAGMITTLIPDDWVASFLGGGLVSMLAMLAVGIPLYICATASTPVAAALILKGVSPGAALVLLLAGPATNLATLTVLLKVLGRRATAIYLASIAIMSVLAGLTVDAIYGAVGISASATVRQAAELVPGWLQWGGALTVIGLSIIPVGRRIGSLLHLRKAPESCSCGSCDHDDGHAHDVEPEPSCGCGGHPGTKA